MNESLDPLDIEKTLNRPGASVSTAMLNPGDTFGQYRIVRRLGQGGMGEVYEAEHAILQMRYALKVLPAELSDTHSIERFRREAQVTAMLAHPHIVGVDDCGETDGRLWLRMKLISGLPWKDAEGQPIVTLQDLAKVIGGKLPQRVVLHLLSQVVEALAHAHKHGVVHRDIKPSNILLSWAGDVPPELTSRPLKEVLADAAAIQHLHARLADFGLVHLLSTEAVERLSLSGSVGVRGTMAPRGGVTAAVVGTYDYMSPEQKRGVEVDRRTDFYSLGVMIYQLLTGRRLGMKTPSQIDPALILEWDELVTTCVQDDPAKRYADARALGEALAGIRRRLCGEKTVVPTATKQPAHDGKGRRLWPYALALVLLVGVSFGISRWITKRPSPMVGVPQQAAVLPVAGKPSATKSPEPKAAWTNSLGMKFAPVAGLDKTLFCIWETRNRDYRAFKADHSSGANFNGDDQPVVQVSWDDAKAFCEWLTEKERSAGLIASGQSYRLPKDWEWSVAVGLNESRAGTPESKSGKTPGHYPWNKGRGTWPPPQGAGNYTSSFKTDSFDYTSPVGSFDANANGLYDLGGNVWEWCEDFWTGQSGSRVLRGGSWDYYESWGCRSAYRDCAYRPRGRNGNSGFRVVLSTATASQMPQKAVVSSTKQTGEPLTVDMGGEVKLEMVWIPPGSFDMGSNTGNSDEKPVHRVTISRGFWMGKYEVTQAQWAQLTGNNPANFKGSQNPVEQVSWNDCQEFLRKLNQRSEGTFRLPTEAEWEYACRAGTTGDYAGDLSGMGWYTDNRGPTHPVGQKQPNSLGLYDMHGNVWEWCQDWSGSYSGESVTDPTGPRSGSNRVLRGGSWIDNAGFCRSASRSGNVPVYRLLSYGFRVVLFPR